MSEDPGPGKKCVHLFVTSNGYLTHIDLTSGAMQEARKQPVEYVMEYTNVFSIGQAMLAMSEESAPEIVCVHLFVTEWLTDVHRSSKWSNATGT